MERPNATGRCSGRWLCLEGPDLSQPVEGRSGYHGHPLERAQVFWPARQAADSTSQAMNRRGSKQVRCAIYTRVSTDQGLEQDFNSLDAQYEASQAYIR